MARKVKKIQSPVAAPANLTVTSAQKSRKILITVVAILLGVAILGGTVAGIVIGAINASYLMYCNGSARKKIFIWKPHGHLFTTVPMWKVSTICMNLIAAHCPDGCTRSTVGIPTMAVPVIS